jgi:hypothetical protein
VLTRFLDHGGVRINWKPSTVTSCVTVSLGVPSGEKLDTHLDKRNPGAPINRCAIGDLERPAGCLSRVRGDSPARSFGEGVISISPPYPTTHLTN